MAGYTHKTTHVTEALARLKAQFADKPKFQFVVDMLARQVQEIEDAFADSISMNLLANASGYLLDRLGKIVGQPRLNFSDAQYRLAIAARIKANRSSGTIEEIYGVLIALVPTGTWNVQGDEDHSGSVVVTLVETIDEGLATVVAALLRESRAGGVKGIFYWTDLDTADLMLCPTSIGMDGGESAGATVIDVHTTTGFPASGTLTLAEGTALQETVTYTGKTATTFTGCSALANTHADGTMVTWADSLGLPLPVAIPLDANESVGATNLDTSDSSDFDASGEITISAGTSEEELVTYTSHSGTDFTADPATTIAHYTDDMVTQGGGGLFNAQLF
jgi:hypothetical protein